MVIKSRADRMRINNGAFQTDELGRFRDFDNRNGGSVHESGSKGNSFVELVY